MLNDPTSLSCQARNTGGDGRRRRKRWGEVAEHRRVSQRLRGQPAIKLHLSPGHPNSAHDHGRIQSRMSSLRVHCLSYRGSRRIHFLRSSLFRVSWSHRDSGTKPRAKKPRINCRYRWRLNRSRPAPKPRTFSAQHRERLSTLTGPGGYRRRYLDQSDRVTSVSSNFPQVP